MTPRSPHKWLVGLTVFVTLAQGPAISWAAHGHGGGGHVGGGHMGGGAHFGGGHMGGGHIGGGGFGGAHFSAPAHHFSAPTHHFSAPAHSFQTPRSLPSANFHTPTMQHHVQPALGNHTANHNNWTLPTHNGATHNPAIQNGLQTRGHTPNVATFGQHRNPTQGVLHNGSNPYLTGNHHGPVGGAVGNAHNTHLPAGLNGHQPLSSLGHNGIGQHGTFKPSLGGSNPLGNHPHIGGHHVNSTNTALANVGGVRNGLHHGGQNLPQFQSHHHGNNGNWGLGGGPRGGNGVNNGNWNNSWRNNYVHHHHHGWYNGAWGGYWGFGGYAPFYFGARYWGLGGFYSPYGYGGYGGYGYGYGGYGYGAYYNPYCVTMVQPVYASLPVNYYTQPVALPQQPVSDEADANKGAAYALVDAARNDFRSGDYQAALTKLDQAIPQLPNDTVVHELRGVTLFALGEYRPAAATLNALLAVAPGMDWATLRGMYPEAGIYESQLRRLEDAARNDQKDPALRFVLAYFYMVTNYPDAAAAQLKKVVELEPKDVVAKKLLETLTPSNDSPVPPAAGIEAATTVPDTDLIGRWRASTNGTTFELSLNDALQFEWQVTPANGDPIKQTGRYTATTDRLILESTGQETLVAKVQSLGTDRFQMWANDKQALVFERQGGASVAKPIDTPLIQPPLPLIPAPRPTGEASSPTPLTPVIGADGLPALSVPVDANQPENPLPPVP